MIDFIFKNYFKKYFYYYDSFDYFISLISIVISPGIKSHETCYDRAIFSLKTPGGNH